MGKFLGAIVGAHVGYIVVIAGAGVLASISPVLGAGALAGFMILKD